MSRPHSSGPPPDAGHAPPRILALPLPAPAPASLPADTAEPMRLGEPCPHCGGSGVLRLGGHRFRTCLECLGQGTLPSAVADPALRALLRRSDPDALGAPEDLTAA